MKMKIIILAGIIILFSGCMTQTMHLKITPSEPEIQWMDGVGMADKNDRGIFIKAGYVEIYKDMLSFFIIVRNESDKVLGIEPTKFECIYESSQAKSTAYAADPGKQIQELESQIKRENGTYQDAGILDFVVDIFNLAAAIGSIGREKTGEEIEAQQQWEDNAKRNSDRENEHIEKLADLENQIDFLDAYALKKGVLGSNQEIRGNIFFAIQGATGSLRLRIPIDSVCFEFKFNQKETGMESN
jgi:hypothetical protein